MILRTRVGVARASSSVRTGMDGRAVVPARRRSSAMTPTRTTRTTARGGRETRSGREVRAFATPDFEEMASGRSRKYYMVGGKGGVGKTSLSSSLAVKFAAEGHHTLVVSTDPAHSLSDSLAQNVRGGMPVEVSDMNGMLYALEIDPESAKEEFTQFARKTDMGSGAKDFMSSVGLRVRGFHRGFKARRTLGHAAAGIGRGDRYRQGFTIHQG